MLTYFEALMAFAETGSMTQAAVRLKISQSAVSKRIAALENELGHNVLERSGRNAVLTSYGRHILERAKPLVSNLKEVFLQEHVETKGRIMIAVSQAILMSWGAPALAEISRKMPNLELHIAAFEGRLAIENVRSGEYTLALCRGTAEGAPDLSAHYLFEEEMVIVPSHLRPFNFRKGEALNVLAVEPHTETYSFLRRRGRQATPGWGFSLQITAHYQTAAVVAQMARAGFGHGLVPIGVAKALGISEKKLKRLPGNGLSVPVSLIGRPTTLALPLVQSFQRTLAEVVSKQG